MTTEKSRKTALAIRLVGAVWGHLVGDAVGVPYEFRDAARVGETRVAGIHAELGQTMRVDRTVTDPKRLAGIQTE